jgi:photosystem II stability/assembly factor-like uncharacterized protein
MKKIVLLSICALACIAARGADRARPGKSTSGEPAAGHQRSPYEGLKFRSIGPAVTGGRILDIVVPPGEPSVIYAAAASAGVWKSTDAGNTWTPIFEHEKAYSTGALAVDPKDPFVVWVGTGESNSQRSVSWGDGIYRSRDGGQHWENMGLPQSRHIGRIIIDPANSEIVYAAAEGSLWGPNKERGLYKTEDGGKTWKNVLFVSENTGVGDVALDPGNPRVLYAAAYQRRRRVYSFIDGGPEAALYKSEDAGASWRKLANGLPKEDLGRIGIAVAPSDPRVVYLTVEAHKKGGVYRSLDRGETWEFRNKLNQTPWYYSRLDVDPNNPDRLYEMGERIMESDDGGKSFHRLPEKDKHVDTHVVWIDPADSGHLIAGCDGGLYISYDRGEHWRFCDNMSLSQFYTVGVDMREPFYHVYGGTQDNNTVGGPSATVRSTGITNADWYVTVGGDGFNVQIDPEDPSAVYSEAQYGDLVRYDTRTMLRIGIQPRPGPKEEPYRWNWNTPIVISRFDHKKIYFGAQYLFMSPDRGDTWKKISPDLTRHLDRDKLPIMGKLWGKDAVGKNQGISFFGNITTIAESSKEQGVLYVGTDDGLIQITRDDGQHWSKIDRFPGVPEQTLVSRLSVSPFEAGTVYAAFDGHKNDDLAPHLLKSTDYGKTWVSIRGDLPDGNPVYVVREDPRRQGLLFAGTEFGVYFSPDAGKIWTKLSSGIPTIQAPDLAVHPREKDLVVATFGRGFYILDDITPLEQIKPETLEEPEHLFAPEPALLYLPSSRFGGSARGGQGAAFFAADNPPFGATLTYFLKKKLEPRKQNASSPASAEPAGETARSGARAGKTRGEKPSPPPDNAEKADEEDVAPWDRPKVVFTISDATGAVIRRLAGSTDAGMHRITWDLREAAPVAAFELHGEFDEEFRPKPRGPLVLPGTYRADMTVGYGDEPGRVVASVPVTITTEAIRQMSPVDRKVLTDFLVEATRADRAVQGTLEAATALKDQTAKIRDSLEETPNAPKELWALLSKIERKNDDILKALRGDPKKPYELQSPSIIERQRQILGDLRSAASVPTTTQREQLSIVRQLQGEQADALRTLIDEDLATLDKGLDAAGAPWTPGRLPQPVK